MKKAGSLIGFEVKRMLLSKTTATYTGIYFISFNISAIFFRMMGSDGSVLTIGNAQSFPIQHLQASFLFTGIFVAIYVGQIITQERTQGTIKLPLTRSISRLEYFMSRVVSIFFFSVFITLLMIVLSYMVGMLFFGWGDNMVFFSLTSGGLQGILITLLSGLAFAFSYFAFGMIAMVISMFTSRISVNATIMGILLMVGQYFEVLPSVKQFAVFHQMLFFHIDIFEKPFDYNVISFLVLVVYCVICSIIGYRIFRKKDLYV
ncbi:ABC transporter permease subunit [Paenibacillus donghaensis]|uniref:ABC transporter permease n=1 Tax=Paenibacillus donghaensis TaxID=414771 RepID=A0A2Z2KJQ4_9BACL|nr:ABC transporter permease subunit [Paenibacillus donghaensis]ASA20031.1 hypothetical protein B9T62_03985 [Paenibacillus donghaensis]